MDRSPGASPAVSLSDGVVVLRPWVRSEAGFIAEASRDPAIARYNGPSPSSVADAVAVIEGFARAWQTFATSGDPSGTAFAIVDAASGEPVGMCGVDGWSSTDVAQFGYWLAPRARGKGFATRAVRLMTSWLCSLGAARVFVTIVSGNAPSAAVARRAGFVYEGTLRGHGVWQGRREDVDVFAVLPQEWGGDDRGAPVRAVATGKRADTLLELMGRVEQFTLGRAWDGLTDEELFFEPIPNMWSVRRRADCTTDMPFGLGEWVVDFGRWGDAPEPMTTIAWLLWHIGSMPQRAIETEVFGGPHPYASGWTSPYLTHHEIFTTADRAVEALRSGWAALRSAIEGMDDDDLERRFARYTYAPGPKPDGVLPVGEPGPLHPATFVAVSIINEVSHHGTQICVLRDLYAHRRR